jgi:hypothetical protein
LREKGGLHAIISDVMENGPVEDRHAVNDTGLHSETVKREAAPRNSVGLISD